MAEAIAIGVKFTGDASDLESATAAGERAWGRAHDALNGLQTSTANVASAFAKIGLVAPDSLGVASTAAAGASQAFGDTQTQLAGVASMFPRLAFLAGPVGVALAAAAAVAGAAWAVLKDKTVDALGEIDGKGITASEAVAASFSVMKDEAISAAKAMAEGVGEWFAGMPKDSNEAFEYIWAGASKVFTAISDFAAMAWQVIVDTWKAHLAGLLATLPALWEGFKNLFVQIGNMGAAAWESIKSGSTAPLQAALKAAARSVVDSARNVGSAYGEGFKSAVTPAMQTVADGVSATFDRLKSKVVENVRATRNEAAAAASGLQVGGTRGGGDGGAAAQELIRQEQALQASITAMSRAGIEARRMLEQDALDLEMRALQQNFQLKRLSEVDYINQSADLQRQKVGKTINALGEELDATEETIARLRAQWISLAVTRGAQDKDAVKTLQLINDAQGRELTLQGAIAKAGGALVLIDQDRQKALDAYADRMTRLQQQLDDEVTSYKRGLQEAANERSFDLSLIGKTVDQQQIARATHQAELEVQRAMNKLAQVELDLRRAIARGDSEAVDALTRKKTASEEELGAARQNVATATAQATEKVYADSSARIQQGLSDALTNALMTGKSAGKAMFDYLKNEALRSVIKIPVQMLTQGASGALSSLFGSASSAAGGVFSTIFGGGGGGGSAASGGGGGGILGSLLGGGGGGGILGSLLGSMPFVGGAGPIAAGTGLAGIAASLGFEGLAAGIAQFATFIPVIGPLIAIAGAILPGLLKNKSGLWFDFGSRAGGNTAAQERAAKDPSRTFTTAQGVTVALQGEGNLADAKPFVTQFQSLAKSFSEIFGKTLNDAAKLKLDDWTGFSSRGRGTEYEGQDQYLAALSTESKDVMAEYFSRLFSVVDDRFSQAISAWSGSTESLAQYIQGILGAKLAVDALTEAVPGFKVSLYAMVSASEDQKNTLTSLAGVYMATTSDYVASAKAAIAASKQTLSEALVAQGAKVAELAKALDGGLASAQALASAEQTRLQMVGALISQIGQVADEVGATFKSSSEEFMLATMSTSEQYEYYDKQAKASFEALGTALDPAKVKEFASQYNADLRAAWNLLTADQKAAAGKEFAELADKANTVAQEQLAKAQQKAEEEANALSEKVAGAVKTAMDLTAAKMEAAADKISTAAESMIKSASEPIIVHGYLDVSTGQQVPLDRQAGAW